LFYDNPPPTTIIFFLSSDSQKIIFSLSNQENKPMAQVKKRPSLSKRQRRAAGPNPSNTWQQQPRIKSAGARARAYISYAGLADDGGCGDNVEGGKTSSSSSSIPPPASSSSSLRDALDPHLDLDSPEVKFGRLLGGTDQRSRHAAVKMLRAYLRGRTDFANGGVGLSELDLLKLWKVSVVDVCACFARASAHRLGDVVKTPLTSAGAITSPNLNAHWCAQKKTPSPLSLEK
jgi:hypothetical protein